MLKSSSTPKIIVIGKEGVGKSQLISSLTGKYTDFTATWYKDIGS